MNLESFEQKLARQPLRQPPVEWRADILSAAQAADPSSHPPPAARHSLLSTLRQPLSSFLWPHPRAWAGLAAAWVVIFAVNVASRDGSATTTVGRVTPPPPQVLELLKQQTQLLAELVGPLEETGADRPKPFAPQPRSQRRDEFLNA
jgi:hypothetical protein